MCVVNWSTGQQTHPTKLRALCLRQLFRHPNDDGAKKGTPPRMRRNRFALRGLFFDRLVALAGARFCLFSYRPAMYAYGKLPAGPSQRCSSGDAHSREAENRRNNSEVQTKRFKVYVRSLCLDVSRERKEKREAINNARTISGVKFSRLT